MTVPVIENIALNIKTSIDEITTDNGFNQNLTGLRPSRNDFQDQAPEDGIVLIVQSDKTRPETQSINTDEWLQTFEIAAIVIDSDDATTSIDTRLNQVESDIVKKLLTDHTRGGYAIDTIHTGSFKFDDGEGITGINVFIQVHYRTVYGNPYTQLS